MNKIKSCCVTGHRSIHFNQIEFVKASLRNIVLDLISQGYTNFISGFAEGVDLYFASIIVELKNDHNITLEGAIPYRNRLNTNDAEFNRLFKCCDRVMIVQEVYSKQCFLERNRYMVDKSEKVIAVYDGRDTGGTLYTINYAKSLNKEVATVCARFLNKEVFTVKV